MTRDEIVDFLEWAKECGQLQFPESRKVDMAEMYIKEQDSVIKTCKCANRVLATGLYCVKVSGFHDCWIADWDGDPGRTLVKENAKTFKRKSDAEKLCKELRAKYPNRNVWVDVF